MLGDELLEVGRGVRSDLGSTCRGGRAGEMVFPRKVKRPLEGGRGDIVGRNIGVEVVTDVRRQFQRVNDWKLIRVIGGGRWSARLLPIPREQ